MTANSRKLFILTCIGFSQTTMAAPGLNLLGDLPLGIFDSRSYAVSADGNVVAGSANSGGGQEAFRWTENGSIKGLGAIAGTNFSTAYGISGDGLTIVGRSHNADQFTPIAGDQAFRWTQSTGMVGLGYLFAGDDISQSAATSFNGSVVVGFSSNSVAGTSEAFRWQNGVMVGLGQLPGFVFPFSYANAVSNDGNTIVGAAFNAGAAIEAFRWTLGTGMVGLGDLAGGAFNSVAYGISGDGSVVVGTGTSAGGNEAFRWTQAGGMVGLGFLPGDSVSQGYGISKNGLVIVGQSGPTGASTAYRWTQAGGMQSVADWLAAGGRPVSNGYVMTSANATNNDGSVIVGEGRNSGGNIEAFLAKLGPFGGGLISINNFNQSLYSSADVLQLGIALPSQIFNTAHGRNLYQQGAITAQGTCVWLAGDWGRFARYDANINTQEIGLCHDFSNTVRAGIGLGKGYARQDLAFKGNTDLNGEYVVAEADWQANPHLLATATGVIGRWHGNVNRGYINSGSQVFSSGNLDMTSVALRTKLELTNLMQVANVGFTPRFSYTYSKANLDSYNETGGGFPAHFDDRDHTAHELKAGLQANMQAAASTWLLANVDVVRRLDNSVDDVKGQVLDGFDFNFAGRSISQNWVQAGLQINQKVSRNFAFSAGLFGATRGEAADYAASVTGQIFF